MPLLLGGFDHSSDAVAALTAQLQIQIQMQMQMQIPDTRYQIYVSRILEGPQTHALQIVHKTRVLFT